MAADHLLCVSSQLSCATPPSVTSSRVALIRNSYSYSSPQRTSSCNLKPRRVTCAVSTQQDSTQPANRRSANYQPNLWNFEFLHSLDNDELEGEKMEEGVRKLEYEVRGLMKRRMESGVETVRLMELIDNVERLGLSYKFEKDINTALHNIFLALDDTILLNKGDLHATALTFRLLRQHGFNVSQDVLKTCYNYYYNKKEKEVIIREDVEGLLSLYEASYVGFEGEEEWLEEAREFAATHLKNKLKEGDIKDTKLGERVRHALELPYQRRVERLEARWLIERYEVKEAEEELVVELAKLDFNRVQSAMKKELQELSRWWREMGLTTKLDFVRDRLMEVYFWALGMAPHPQHSHLRMAITKMFGLVTIIDDVYDVYATLDELQLFTHAVHTWDVNAVDTLPDYMKLCFLALYNTVNDTVYATLLQKGVNTLPYLVKSWRDLCKAFLQEAKWSNKKIIPGFKEYLRNASVSSSGGALLAPCYFFLVSTKEEEAIDCLSNFKGMVGSSCAIFRLCNDLATSAAELERGETTNSITSYMNENVGTSEEEARERLRHLIDQEWNKMNRDRVFDSTFPNAFKDIAINMARVSHCTYQYGDGLGRPDDTAETRIKLLLLDPIPIHHSSHHLL